MSSTLSTIAPQKENPSAQTGKTGNSTEEVQNQETMASVTSFTPASLTARPSSDEMRRRRPSAFAASPSSSSWWTPIFGWSAEPDYLDSTEESKKKQEVETSRTVRFAPGCFTEEKAKQLRMKTMETETFHDFMYHSAIASRLASDRRSG